VDEHKNCPSDHWSCPNSTGSGAALVLNHDSVRRCHLLERRLSTDELYAAILVGLLWHSVHYIWVSADCCNFLHLRWSVKQRYQKKQTRNASSKDLRMISSRGMVQGNQSRR